MAGTESSSGVNGYTGRIAQVNLGDGSWHPLRPSDEVNRTYVGGTALGARYLFDAVPPGVAWDDPANRVILATGPLAGTPVAGAGTFSCVFKGPMTNLAGASQANGFLGAYLKFSGFDGLILDGASPEWVYLYAHDGIVELRDATSLLGKTTLETEQSVARELGLSIRQLSVFAIGPAGEHLVRFAGLVGDRGHAAAHNGLGAVLGAKRVKAIAVAGGRRLPQVHDRQRLLAASRALMEHAKVYRGGSTAKWGTAGGLANTYRSGMLPIRNYTTSIFPEYERFTGQYLRANFPVKPAPCWACGVNHLRNISIPSGAYAGFEGEEPEYEAMAAWGPLIGQTDPAAAIVLSNSVDWLGLDTNESGWLVAWVMECYGRGILSSNDLGGLEMTWGNTEAVLALLRLIAWREGPGQWLAEGVMRASQYVGGEAPALGVYTFKGASPRGHDHRARWYEMLDTAVSGTSTIEAAAGSAPDLPGMPALTDPFAPELVVRLNVASGGWRQFEDCIGTCRFCTSSPPLVMECLNAVTGWDMTLDEAQTVGRRAINLLRLFNLRHGLDLATEAPSPRYGSTPVDGPAQDRAIAPHWDQMVRQYRTLMGWDPDSGQPLPETLGRLGLSPAS